MIEESIEEYSQTFEFERVESEGYSSDFEESHDNLPTALKQKIQLLKRKEKVAAARAQQVLNAKQAYRVQIDKLKRSPCRVSEFYRRPVDASLLSRVTVQNVYTRALQEADCTDLNAENEQLRQLVDQLELGQAINTAYLGLRNKQYEKRCRFSK